VTSVAGGKCPTPEHRHVELKSFAAVGEAGDTPPVNEIRIRAAEPDEAELLTMLTRRAKAHWGYPQAMMDRWAEMLSVSSRMKRNVADLFLEPEAIGTGLGRTLWEHAVTSARRAGFHATTSGSGRVIGIRAIRTWGLEKVWPCADEP
jgi:GNAT superfamily N-acetyltransferase